jgi:hypothetical protein
VSLSEAQSSVLRAALAANLDGQARVTILGGPLAGCVLLDWGMSGYQLGPTSEMRQRVAQDHDPAGFDGWALYEATPGFRAWATPSLFAKDGGRRRMAIIQPEPGAGLVWVLLAFTNPLPGERPTEVRRSRGAFYDGAPDHPEGAVEWASGWARAYLEMATE